MEFIKKTYSAGKLKQIDNQAVKIENLGFEIEVMKMNLESKGDI